MKEVEILVVVRHDFKPTDSSDHIKRNSESG